MSLQELETFLQEHTLISRDLEAHWVPASKYQKDSYWRLYMRSTFWDKERKLNSMGKGKTIDEAAERLLESLKQGYY